MHYKAPDNSLHFLDDDSFAHVLPEGSIAITDDEAEALRPVPAEPTYKELRAAEYNLKSTGEQFAMQYDDAVNGTTTWVDWQDGIKAAIPKSPIAT